MKKKVKVNNHKRNDSLLHFIDSYFQEVIKCLVLLDKSLIEEMIDLILEAYKNNHKIYILGNGGAASTSSHMACDLGKGTLARVYNKKEKRLSVISLTDNIALLSAYANDISFDEIFVQQLRNLIEKDDVAIGISGSGNTKNVLNAMEYSKSIGAKTIGLTGFRNGGKLAGIVDLPIIIDTNHYGPIEDIHLIIGHLVAAAVASFKLKEDPTSKIRENRAVPFFINE